MCEQQLAVAVWLSDSALHVATMVPDGTATFHSHLERASEPSTKGERVVTGPPGNSTNARLTPRPLPRSDDMRCANTAQPSVVRPSRVCVWQQVIHETRRWCSTRARAALGSGRCAGLGPLRWARAAALGSGSAAPGSGSAALGSGSAALGSGSAAPGSGWARAPLRWARPQPNRNESSWPSLSPAIWLSLLSALAPEPEPEPEPENARHSSPADTICFALAKSSAVSTSVQGKSPTSTASAFNPSPIRRP